VASEAADRRRQGRARIGCSGWQYKHWQGAFYPADCPQAEWLEFYASRFDTVEINNSFYRLPEAATVTRWRERAPAGFLFAFKASRYLTHMKKLKDPEDPLDRLFSRACLLRQKLGPVLYQLPPNFKRDIDRLQTFLRALPHGPRHTVEFRDASWYDEEVIETLDAAGVALCLHDMPGSATARELARGTFVYVRFHGAESRYAGGYPSQVLEQWAQWLTLQLRAGKDAYVYFNNDVGAHAPRDATKLRELVEGRC
jgi:uncharacterized protein YecE (DUF72 family)